jgi:hypothetical protein
LEEDLEEYVPYRAYLIRLWPTVRGGVAGCRVSTQCVSTGERKVFPDLESLLTFLRAEVRKGPGDREPGAETGLQV